MKKLGQLVQAVTMQFLTGAMVFWFACTFGILAGCGGGGEGDSSTKPTDIRASSSGALTIYLVNEAGAPTDQFAQAVAYIQTQFSHDVNPRYGWSVSIAQSAQVVDGALNVRFVGGPGSGPNGANSYTNGSAIGVTHYNGVTIGDGTCYARLSHITLNLADQDLLIGQRFEAHDYNADDYTETQQTSGPLKEFYALCDFTLPSGALDCHGNMGKADFLGTHQ